MLMSKLLGERFKEKPSDAVSMSHIFLLRGGYIRQVSNGIFSLLLPAKRIATKIENIIREEMNKIDGQEVLFPVVLPGDLWEESGRFDGVGNELVRFKDRAGKDMVLGMTHEEAAVHLARTEVHSYTQFPFMIYQIQTKFRDEPRARGGLIRVREFTMKDAYSFHASQQDLESYYQKCLAAYNNIYRRVGIPEVVCVGSDTGMMGGKVAHEFMYLSDIGEDTIVVCNDCDYHSNIEVATSYLSHPSDEEEIIQEVYTPEIKDIDSLAEFFKVSPSKLLKAALFQVEGQEKPLLVFIRGDKQVNEAKVRGIIKSNITPFTAYGDIALSIGFIGPYNLDKDNIRVIFDTSLQEETNLICGANKPDYHLKGISMARDIKPEAYYDVANVNEGDLCIRCGGTLKFQRGIEVGNIFQLGTKYTESMKMTYIDKDGKSKHPIMGCYGIGVGRLLACILEAHHDEYGPVWPTDIAPWEIHICVIKSKKFDADEVGLHIYNQLKDRYEVILDDRDIGPGAKFADADLLGVPVRIMISERNMKNNQIEICSRDKKMKSMIQLEDLEDEIQKVMVALHE